MKIWVKVHITDKNKTINNISKSLTNYLYGYGPIQDICRKYNISPKDRSMLDQYTANRIGGLLLLYFTNDKKRINDIVNKYNIDASYLSDVIPEIEGYVEKK